MIQDENMVISAETLIRLFQSGSDPNNYGIKNNEIFILGVMKKVKQEALIRTTVISVIIGACAFFLFPQI